ncbi:MAG: ABC transporter ATP-binding protein [Xanthomonadales bacterium]|nr:ABC transporter ATP-binding protein [Xanthomonadales bacterium]
MDSSIAIELDQVSVQFERRRKVAAGAFVALHDVSVELRRGERLGIIGRNGAGKSTLLRVFADVLKPDRGKVRRNHGLCQLLALGVGFMPALTGRENAVLSGLLQGIDRRTVVSRLEEICEFAELGEFFDEPLSSYSTGMAARLGFAVAMQNQPDILLIDEVLSVGDVGFQAKSLSVLRERLGQGATAVMVSHSAGTIAGTCDRVIWLEHGRVVASGAVDKVLLAYEQAI